MRPELARHVMNANQDIFRDQHPQQSLGGLYIPTPLAAGIQPASRRHGAVEVMQGMQDGAWRPDGKSAGGLPALQGGTMQQASGHQHMGKIQLHGRSLRAEIFRLPVLESYLPLLPAGIGMVWPRRCWLDVVQVKRLGSFCPVTG